MDILLCTLVYGASPNNYYHFHFYELKHNQRKTYVTHRVNQKMIKKYNELSKRDLFENKATFAKLFSNFFKREWLNMNTASEDDFKKFIMNKDRFIVKLTDSAQGIGIEVIYLEDHKDVIDYISTFT